MAKFLIRPGSILVILIIGLVLAAMFSWADDTLRSSKNQSLDKQNKAIKCSNLEVDFVDRDFNGTHQKVFIQTNRPVEQLLVRFKGSKNASKTVNNVERNSIISVTAQMESVSEINAQVQSCDRVFG